jgi:hypothetical protein
MRHKLSSTMAPRGSDPSSGTTFGCGCTMPDIAADNPIVGSGSSRQIQLGFKFTF